MSIIGDKQNILAKIAALNTLNDGLPKFNASNSLDSINNNSDTIGFLVDVMAVLGIAQDLIKEITDFLVHNIPVIEKEIKEELKNLLKEYISCKSNPAIPDYMLKGNAGITTELKNIDFYDIFKVNPKSTEGSLIYDNNYSGLASTDLNTFLYEVVQLNGTTEEWTGSNANPVMEFVFNQTGGSTNNELKINVSSYYSDPSNNKSLIDLNNDFIDSIHLFTPDKIISGILDALYGFLTFKVNKSQKQVVKEQELNNIINNLITEDSDDLDDSFFEFTSAENSNNELISKDRKNGIRRLASCGNLESSLDFDKLASDLNDIASATTVSALSASVSNTLTNVADDAASNANPEDQDNVKRNLIELIIKQIADSLIKTIISPKMVVMFLVNHKIVYGTTDEWNGGVDFLRKNKSIMKKISNKARELVIQILLSLVIKVITFLVNKEIQKRLKEVTGSNKAVLLSLFGVPQEILRLIQGLR